MALTDRLLTDFSYSLEVERPDDMEALLHFLSAELKRVLQRRGGNFTCQHFDAATAAAAAATAGGVHFHACGACRVQ
jgi:hypothetical protein